MFQSIIIYAIVIPLFYFVLNRKASRLGVYCSSMGVKKDCSTMSQAIAIVIILFSLLAGMRYDVGTDYLGYLACYQNYNYSGDVISSRMELGFTFIMDICNRMKLSPMIFFGIIALLQMTFFLWAFRRENYLLPLQVFFLFVGGGYMLWMNIIRQSLALSLWMFSLYYIEDKKFLLYFSFCLLASLFHFSAILLIILYPLLMNGKRYFESIPIQYVIIAVAFIIRVLFYRQFHVLTEYYSAFANSEYDNYLERLHDFGNYSNSNVVFWFKLFINCIIILYSPKLYSFYNSKRFNIIYTLFFVGFFIKCVIPFDMSLLTRPFVFFLFFESVMYAYFVYYLSKVPERWNNIIKLIMIVSFIGVFFLNQIVSGDGSSVWYQFYFEQSHNKLLYL